MNDQWTHLASDEVIEKTTAALTANGIETVVVENGQDAFQKVFEILPLGANVMNMTSITLETIGVEKEIMESGKYDAVRNNLLTMDRATQGHQMQMMGAAPVWSIGSVHAVTQEGQVVIASNSGSQIPAHSYGAEHVIWVVGTHKIVENLQEGLRRVYEHSLPLESERARKAYGVEGSNVSKLLIFNREPKQGRITLILVKEVLGY